MTNSVSIENYLNSKLADINSKLTFDMPNFDAPTEIEFGTLLEPSTETVSSETNTETVNNNTITEPAQVVNKTSNNSSVDTNYTNSQNTVSKIENSPTSSSMQYYDIVDEMSKKYNVPVELINKVIKAESNFNKDAVSSVGAIGLMQLMPSTAKSLGVENPYDPKQNIEGGVKYLSQLLKQFGNTTLAVAAYNAGPGNIIKYGYTVPPFKETQDYVKKILGV